MPRYGSLARVLPALLRSGDLAATPPAEPLDGEVWLPDLQMMAARERPGSSQGLYVAAWGGHNAQSHNHNDVGNVIVFADGQPVLIDVGVGEYTAKTFSSRRYEIWTMQSAWHNLPTINGVDQGAGAGYRAEDAARSRSTAGSARSSSPGPAGRRSPPGASPGPRSSTTRGASRRASRRRTDSRLRAVWGGRLFRIMLTARQRARRGSHRLVVRAGR